MINNLRQLEGYTVLPIFLENSEPKTGRAQILTILKQSVTQTYNSAK